MGILGGRFGEWILSKVLIPLDHVNGSLATASSSFKEVSQPFGLNCDTLRDLTILDFGCGSGQTVLDIAKFGPQKVIGLDIRESILNQARQSAEDQKVSNCIFVNSLRDNLNQFYGTVDVIISIDAFEHYPDPGRALVEMEKYLKPNGQVYISFGPPWWHPYGPHLQFMTRLPWPHVVFKEALLMSARGLYKHDGAKQFEQVEGGLNRMSVNRFQKLVQNSALLIKNLELIPIRRMRHLQKYCPGGRELFTSCVKASLQKR